MILVAVLYGVIVALLFYYINCVKPNNFPPGPTWYPLVGCLPIFEKVKKKLGYVHLSFLELAKIYGPILGLKLGKQKFVVIHSAELVKKALLKDEFNGRPNGFFFKTRAFGKDLGLLFTEGSQWSQQRKFTIRHLKNFGFGTGRMAHLLNYEVQEFIEQLRVKSKKGPVLMHTIFDVPTLNILWTMFAGHRFEYNDKKLREILLLVHEVFRLNNTLGGILSEMPWLRWVAPNWSGYNELMMHLKLMWSFLDDEITEHERTLSEDEPRDLIDAFLMEIDKHNPQDKSHIFSRENLLILCFDLFLAGSKTTTDSLAMIFCYLGANLKWVGYCQLELDEVIGRNRPPTVADMQSLPKIQAFITEAQRALTITPLGVTHKCTEETIFNGYFIPRDTNVVLNLYTCNMDPKIWTNPEKFDPERFLNEKGEFLNNNPTIPFGLGKRRCLGEGMARHSLFLIFVSILYYFNLDISEEHGQPNQNGDDGFVVSPKPFYLKLTLRTDVS